MPIHTSPTSRARALALLAAPALVLSGCARATAETAPAATTPVISSNGTSGDITDADLRTRVYVFADDSMRGRQAGTEGDARGVAYIEREVRRLGLEPAGDSGTFFQTVPLVKRAVMANARLEVNGAPVALWTEAVPLDAGPNARVIGQSGIVYAGSLSDTASLAATTGTAGKAVIVHSPSGLPFQFVVQSALRRYPEANAVLIAGADQLIANYANYFRAGNTFLGGSPQDVTVGPTMPSVVLLTTPAAERLIGGKITATKPGTAGGTLRGDVRYERVVTPARNVVAIWRGGDAALRGQYVALGSHSDHIGVVPAVDHDSLRAFHQAMHDLGATDPFTPIPADKRASIRVNVDSLRQLRPARRDSINNGADDDGSGSMALLEIAERLATMGTRPRRSVIFVWHTAEELGLFGSEWFTEHPTVPLDSVVAQLNMDMVGRGSASDVKGGGPTYLQLVGSKRLSKELGSLVEQVNTRQPMPFSLDYGMDATNHPEQIYCRSDHANYARFGIPVTFFTTGQHLDYHQVTDEPQYLQYPHLMRVTRFVFDVTTELANRATRPALDGPKPSPGAECRQ